MWHNRNFSRLLDSRIVHSMCNLLGVTAHKEPKETLQIRRFLVVGETDKSFCCEALSMLVSITVIARPSFFSRSHPEDIIPSEAKQLLV